MPGIFAAISFTPSRTCFLSAAETPSFHWITDTWMIVFGVPKLFCATSQVAVALSDISVVTTAMRNNVVIEDLLLAARGESLAAFDGRCIPAPPQRGCRVGDPGASCVAPRSNTPGIATPPRKPRAAGARVLGRPPSFAGHSRSHELRRDLAGGAPRPSRC